MSVEVTKAHTFGRIVQHNGDDITFSGFISLDLNIHDFTNTVVHIINMRANGKETTFDLDVHRRLMSTYAIKKKKNQ